MSQRAVPACLMRGGTSKGLYFLSRDLPVHPATRDAVLLAAIGSPDARQIDGLGGAHPLTSKVAVVGPATRADADVDYRFLQVAVDSAQVSGNQNCGNLLAGVGPFAIETGLVAATGETTDFRIHMVNTASIAVARVQTPGGRVRYDGDTAIDGVPGTAAPIPIDFLDVAGGSCGALLPTGHARDKVAGVEVTMIDNGMPVVMLRAADFGVRGDETPEALEADGELRARVEQVRLACGPLMNLGDVSAKTVPKMTLVAPPARGGALATRSFIPHRVHEAIGVFGAVSVATACVWPGSVAAEVAGGATGAGQHRLDIEHPTGFFTVDLELGGEPLSVRRAALLRTARLLMRGEVYVPAHLWPEATP